MNYWSTRKLVKVILAVQFAILGLIGLDLLNYDVPMIRQIIGLIYLLFIPGLLIIRILGVHNLDITKTYLYSIGLSVAFVMFIGILLNYCLPYIGFPSPISIVPLSISIASFIAVFCIIAYFKDRHLQPAKFEFDRLEIRSFLSPPYLFLSLLLLLNILGSLFVNLYNNEQLLLISVMFLAVIPALIALDKCIPSKAYSFAILVVAISLLSSQNLVSDYFTHGDIHAEYYYQNLVLKNGFWDTSISSAVNAMLSIVMVCPIYSLILDMDSIWVFKSIYPLIFSLVPLALFETYKNQLGPKSAFLAAFLFMSVITFFTELPTLARQEIAEVFLALLIFNIVVSPLSKLQSSIFSIIFILSLAVSHYGLAYLFLIILIFSLLIVNIPRLKGIRSTFYYLNAALNKSFKFACNGHFPAAMASCTKSKTNDLVSNGYLTQHYWDKKLCNFMPEVHNLNLTSRFTINPVIVCLYIVFILMWYMYNSNGRIFQNIIGIGDHIGANIFEILNPNVRQPLLGTALGLDYAKVSQLAKIFRLIQYSIQLLILIGLFSLYTRLDRFKINLEYLIMSLVSGLIIFFCFVIPYFSYYMGLTRIFHICLFFLSLFCIVGIETLGIWVNEFFKFVLKLSPVVKFSLISGSIRSSFDIIRFTHIFFVFILLTPYFLFNTGFIFEVSNYSSDIEHRYLDIPWTKGLSGYKMEGSLFNLQEVRGSRWLRDASNEKLNIYADNFGRVLLIGFFGPKEILGIEKGIPKGNIIFLRTWNIENKEVDTYIKNGALGTLTRINFRSINLTDGKDLIYNNQKCQLFY